jgi:signal transduction histidine kinase
MSDENPSTQEAERQSQHATPGGPHWHSWRGRFPRRTPPWWPAGEPWPPQGPPNLRDWPGTRRRFFWRFGCIIGLLFFLVVAGGAAVIWMAFNVLSGVSLPGGILAVIRALGVVVVLLIFSGTVFVFRSLRATAAPIGSMLEAAERVAGRDYSARVAESGPGEVRALVRAFNTMAERLQAADEQRRNLLADVSHELRTPLTIIQGNLEGLLDGIYPADADHINAILEETRVLSRMIDDLRTLSLAESGALQLQLEMVDIAEVVDDVAHSFQVQAAASQITLQSDIQPILPMVEIDPIRIREVLVNLLANALRYTPQGGRIQIDCGFKDGDQSWLQISISDSGAGINARDLPHIFDRFYKTSDSHGSGLGLAIARGLVIAHGGEIEASTEVGEGTTIRFRLPIASSR